MAMRIKVREKKLLLTCRSANKVEQVKIFKDGLRDTTKRKNHSKCQNDETERFDVYTRKRSKNIRITHSENQMQIPVKQSAMTNESTKVGLASINDSNEDNYKKAHNVNRQSQNYSIKYMADTFKTFPRTNEDHEKGTRSKESNQFSYGCDRQGDRDNKVIFVSLNSIDKSEKCNKRRKPTNQIKLRRLWKNLQHISGHHKKQKIGRLRKYCCQKLTSIIRKYQGKNESTRNDTENDKISLRQNKTKETTQLHWEEVQDEESESIFDSESVISNNSKVENNANMETSDQVTDELDPDSTDFLQQKDPHLFNKLTPEDDVSKIDEKYLKYILLITNTENKKMIKNNENQENINDGEERVEEILSKYKKSINVLKVRTSQNELKAKQIPSTILKVNDRSKEYLIQNKKSVTDHKIEIESKTARDSIALHQPTKQRKKIIVLKLSHAKQSDHSGKPRINNKKESGPANTKEDKNNSRKPNSTNSTNPTSKKKEPMTTSPRGEVSKFEFIEIWRRNSGKESQDSLSTHSSTDQLENQEEPDSDSSDDENLGIRSYQALKKVVEQEVMKIFKSYMHKEEVQSEKKKVESKTTEENTKAPVLLKKRSDINTMNKAQLENKVQSADKQVTVINDHSDVISDRVTHTKMNLSPQKEKLQETRLPPQNQNFTKQDIEREKLRLITRNNSEELNKKLKILSEQENKDFKIPSEILKNWTIMHRLEKAFLALATPNFHSKTLPPLTKTRVVEGKVSSSRNEKVGAVKTRTRTDGVSVREESRLSRSALTSSKNKISQKKLETKHLGRSETEQKVKRRSEKEMVKESRKSGSNVQDLLHSRKPTPAPSIKKFPDSSRIKKPEEISLNKDHKSKIKNRFKPDSLSRVPRRVFENNSPKRSHRIEKPIQAQEVSAKPNRTFVKSEPTCKDNNNNVNNAYLNYKVGFFVDHPVLSVPECNHVNERDFAEEAKHLDSQIEKLLSVKSSKKQLFERRHKNKIENENLERKQTFAVFPVTETTNLKTKKSQSCHKLEVNCITNNVKSTSSNTNQKYKFNYWDPFDQKNKKSGTKQHPGSKPLQKTPKYPSKREKILKIGNDHSFTDDDYVFDKISMYSDEDIAPGNPFGFSELQPNKAKIPMENPSHKLLFTHRKVNLDNRVVKKRSILSLGQNFNPQNPSSETITKTPTIKDLKKPQNKPTPDVFLQRIFHTKDIQSNYSNMSATSTATYDIEPKSSIGCEYPGYQTQKPIIASSNLRPAPPTEDISSTTFKTIQLTQKLSSPSTRTTKIQPNWERDIQQYRAIVKDIIDQYKRTKGFLKQNEALLDSQTSSKFIELQGETPTSSKFRHPDINEYRRKIISEYRDLSIFEYKSKIQEKSKPNDKKTERGLTVVKEVTPEMDYDVKDFQPNVQKVLNSQIYVDQNHFYKLKHLREKPTDQNPSLQEVMLGTSKLETQQIKLNEQSKSACIPKSNVSLPNSKVYSVLFHTPNHSKLEVDNDFTFEDFMSLSEFEETESDFTDYH